jgi:hypothetical protein
MITASVIVLIRLHYGSRNQFALTLATFTLLLSFQEFEGFLVFTFPRTIDQTIGPIVYLPNYYVSMAGNYFYYLMALQTWMFAIRYLESALNCSQKPALNYDQIQFLKWTIIILYSGIILSFCICMLVLYPGYLEDGSTADYHEWYNS